MFDHFRLLAPIYDRLIKPPERQRLQALLGLPAEGTLLDAGGGTGRVAQQLRPLVGALVVSDESPAMLHQARNKGLAATVAAGVEQLPFASACFSRVLVVDALHHFADQQQAIAELVRVLQPGGRLVIEEPDLNRLAVKAVALAEKLALMRSRFLYPHQIADLLRAQGLPAQMHQARPGSSFAVWIIADKPQGGTIRALSSSK